MKYYVYVTREDGELKNHLFVQDLTIFAAEQYNPATMEFSGVVIDAADHFAAKRAYDAPYEEEHASAISWIDEPVETATYQQVQDELKKAEQLAHVLRSSTLAIKIAREFEEINKQLSRLAHYIRVFNTKSPNISTEELYGRLKEKYIDHFKRIPYKPHGGS